MRLQITKNVVIALVDAAVGLLIIYLALSGRLERILKILSRQKKQYDRGLEPMRLGDFSKDEKGEAKDMPKTRER